jgi:electron transfer flavoprotein beta subunit
LRVIVCIKQIGYIYHPVAIDFQDAKIDPEKIVYMLNPYDEVALEEGVKIKERFEGSEVTIITAGPLADEKSLRYAFAFGADRMIRINCQCLSPSSISLALAEAIKHLEFDIILCGKKAIDTNDNQVGPSIAELLNIVQVSGIVRLEVFPQEKKAIVERYLGKGDREAIECDLPALFTVEKALNDPRYPTLPNRLRAEKQEIERLEISSFGIPSDPELELGKSMKLSPPRPKPFRLFTPDSGLSASERLRLIMSGGITEKKSDLLEGTPEEVSDKIMEVLIQEKII